LLLFSAVVVAAVVVAVVVVAAQAVGRLESTEADVALDRRLVWVHNNLVRLLHALKEYASPALKFGVDLDSSTPVHSPDKAGPSLFMRRLIDNLVPLSERRRTAAGIGGGNGTASSNSRSSNSDGCAALLVRARLACLTGTMSHPRPRSRPNERTNACTRARACTCIVTCMHHARRCAQGSGVAEKVRAGTTTNDRCLLLGGCVQRCSVCG
jgi:hypothetical protein